MKSIFDIFRNKADQRLCYHAWNIKVVRVTKRFYFSFLKFSLFRVYFHQHFDFENEWFSTPTHNMTQCFIA